MLPVPGTRNEAVPTVPEGSPRGTLLRRAPSASSLSAACALWHPSHSAHVVLSSQCQHASSTPFHSALDGLAKSCPSGSPRQRSSPSRLQIPLLSHTPSPLHHSPCPAWLSAERHPPRGPPPSPHIIYTAGVRPRRPSPWPSPPPCWAAPHPSQ